MTLSMINLSIQFSAWLIALVEVVLGLYVLVLNARYSTNRHTSALLLVMSTTLFSVGWMINADSANRVLLPAILLAITTPAIPLLLLVTTIALLKSEWLDGRIRFAGWLIYLLALIPALLTLFDLGMGSNYWFSGVPVNEYTGGFVQLDQVAAGMYAHTIRLVTFELAPALTLLCLISVTLFDKRNLSSSRRLAWLLIVANVAALLLSKYPPAMLPPAFRVILANTVVAAPYSYIAFKNMVSERVTQKGSLQARLVALIMIVSMPLLVAVSVFVTGRAGARLEQDAMLDLQTANRGISSIISSWADSQGRALKELALQPGIASMDPIQQEPILEAMTIAYPHLSLVSTIDLNGFNVARSDSQSPIDYSDQAWFQEARQGTPLTYQMLVYKTNQSPTLIASTPIWNDSGEIAGVAMFTTDIDAIAAQIHLSQVVAKGSVFVVDSQNKALVHPGLASTSQLKDMSSHPAIAAVRNTMEIASDGIMLSFTDEAGLVWRANANLTENSWIVVVQRPESELLAGVVEFQRLALIALAAGALLLMLLSWFTIRQAILPIRDLTETAASIASGDLTRVAAIRSDDEIGSLARAFNSMTTQLRESIANLERRIAERTRDLERRAVQLHVAADVASQAAAIRDLAQLLESTVRLISERFNFYHAGIFLIDESGKFALLRAASSEGGKRMLARNHRLAVGQTGIVGYVAGKGEPRIASDVGNDAIYFNNPDLPQTRSEMALPLKVRGRTIGVLDVQSTKAAAFTSEDVEVLQVLADQLAVAIDNALIHAESEDIIRELNTLYQQQISQSWQRQLDSDDLAYSYHTGKVRKEAAPGLTNAHQENNERLLAIPITLRGQSLGEITLRRYDESPTWSEEEIAFAKQVTNQIALSLENARLLEENRRNALQETLLSQITGKTQGLLDIEAVLKAATKEIGRSLGLSRVQICLEEDSLDAKRSDEAVEVLSTKTGS